jgi:RNA polymerase II subunit A-like phosphatase
LESKKLSLVVDLDQTIIQATVEPTVAEWQKDPNNPNYEAVKDVQAFQLVDDAPAMRGCWYYIKMRPGLKQFLDDMAEKYELHVYTMGTRAYAEQVCKIVDPQKKIFSDRILSRDESGSMHMKHLHRLFPVNTNMVAIIDDRADVWNWSPHLIKVLAYDFFVGVGDINSHFLKKQDEVSKPESSPAAITNGAGAENKVNTAEGDNGTSSSALEKSLVAAAEDGDFTAQAKAQEDEINRQIADRPLARQQQALDQLDEAEELVNGEASETSSEHSQGHNRHKLLVDSDQELLYLQRHLENVHKAFFDEYEQQKKRLASARVAELRGEKGSPKKPSLIDDLTILPDISIIMPAMKKQVLGGVVVCFTGVIPQGYDPKTFVYRCPQYPYAIIRQDSNFSHIRHDLGMWVTSFGGRINTSLTKSTTHVIAHKDRRTSKVRQATQHPQIQIVNICWLLDCFSKWEHVEEEPFRIDFGVDHGPQDSLPFDEYDEGVTLTPSEDGVDPVELPEDQDAEPLSPGFESKQMDWDKVDNEVDEFMGSDAESDIDFNSDSEAEASDASVSSNKSGARKRKRAPSSVDGTETGEAEDATALSAENAAGATSSSGSALQKRRKKASERTTGLANMTVPEKSSGLPSPETTGPEENEAIDGVDAGPNGQDQAITQEDGGDDEDAEELERQMLEAMSEDSAEPEE